MSKLPPCINWETFSSNVHSEWRLDTTTSQCSETKPFSGIENYNEPKHITLDHTKTKTITSHSSNFNDEPHHPELTSDYSYGNYSQQDPPHSSPRATSSSIIARNASSPSYPLSPPSPPKLNFFESLQSRFLSWFAFRHWRVKILIHALTAMQAPVTLLIVPCSATASYHAGYSPPHHTIWMCANRIWNPFSYRRALTHELIHAFDFARANIDPFHCPHVACTEIRAYHLSQQCGFLPTLAENNDSYPAASHLSDKSSKRDRCIVHHTMLSLYDHPHCKSQSRPELEKVIETVYDRCISDPWPFMGPADQDSSWRPSRIFLKTKNH